VLTVIPIAVYIDDLPIKQASAGRGCHICGVFIGCILSDDDIFLLSTSVVDMQRMLDLCGAKATELDLCFYVKHQLR